MKIKVLMALAVLPLLAFECCDDTDTWQFRCQRGSEFTLYPQDVLEEVIGESLMSLNFVQSVIDSHNGSPSLGIHSVKDRTGWEYLVENRIEKSDTIWFDARRRMRIRRSYFQQRRYNAGRQTAHLFLQGGQENRLDKC